MRQKRVLLAVAVLIVAALIATNVHAITKTFGINETYQFGNRTLIIEPFNINGTGYRENTNLRIWRIGDCQESGVLQTCLKSATGTSATFDETNRAASLKATHRLLTSSTRAGNEIEGELVVTNDGERIAREVTLTLTVLSPATFSSGSTMYTTQTTMSPDGRWTPTYRIERSNNGTTVISGTIHYNDGNTTKNLTIRNVTATFTIPFTEKVAYVEQAVTTAQRLDMNLTRTAANLTLRTTITFPPEAVITEHSRALRLIAQNTLQDSDDFIESSRINYTVEYRFTEPPSRPLTITYSYTELGESLQAFTRTYPFTVQTNGPEPIITLNANTMNAGVEGAFTVSVLGARGGKIHVTSELVQETLSGTPNSGDASTYTLITKPSEAGEYPVSVVYEWSDSFGRVQTMNGSSVIIVMNTTNATQTDTIAGSDANGNETTNTDSRVILTQPEEEERDRTLWIGSGVATGCLAALLWLLHRVRDPVRRVEHLLRRTIELRTALIKRRRTPTEEELAELAELEEYLDELKRELG